MHMCMYVDSKSDIVSGGCEFTCGLLCVCVYVYILIERVGGKEKGWKGGW